MKIDKDLEYIARHVDFWPCKESTHVRLDLNGEICWSGSIEYDFSRNLKQISTDALLVGKITIVLGLTEALMNGCKPEGILV